MNPFPKAIAEAQRNSLATDIRDAYDQAEAVLANVGLVKSAHLVNLTDGDLNEIQRALEAAKDELFLARVLAEKGQP